MVGESPWSDVLAQTFGGGAYRIDDIARPSALTYAAATMHFVKHQSILAAFGSHDDFSESPLRRQTSAWEGHLGAPPLVLDAEAQRHFDEVVAHREWDPLLGTRVVVGEEVPAVVLDGMGEGRLTLVRCDPVDGTQVLSHSGDGFSTVVTMESRKNPHSPWRHYCGAIVRSDGCAISWTRSAVYMHFVVLDPRHRPTVDHVPDILDLGMLPPFANRVLSEQRRLDVAGAGACVAAASPARREAVLERFGHLVTGAPYFDLRAGTPAGWALCTGLLGWLLEPSRTTIHDSIHLFPFTLLGGRVFTTDFERIDARQLFEDHAGPGETEKIIPPYVACVFDESMQLIRGTPPP
jgi:hypothetical protein